MTVVNKEDKLALSQRRADLVARLSRSISTEERVRLQGELSVVNAKIKGLNKTEAAQLKAAADRRRVAGLVEARANAERSRAKLLHQAGAEVEEVHDEDDDSVQTQAIDAWIDAVLRRGGVKARRSLDGLDLEAPAKWVAIVHALCSGIHAAARGQELPEVTAAPSPGKRP